ncbi:MAG: type VI secretion system lipoprotein TssJ [Gammaproteobacteria bacterium]|nr:type VI secretion system lipoprotein TssJ [Gammaproteobacteria bacterium]
MQHIQSLAAQVRTLALVLLTTTLLTGCGVLQSIGLLPKPPEAAPTPLAQVPYQFELELTGADDLNVNSNARPSPIRLRLFLTESTIDLVGQPFETLFEFNGAKAPAKPAAVVVLTPGNTRRVTINGMRNQDQLVIAAAFQDLYSSSWIASRTINTANPGTITARVDATSVEIQ